MATTFNVEQIQIALNGIYGEHLAVDKKFGPLTKAALERWASYKGLSITATASTGSRTVRISPDATAAKLQSVLQLSASSSAEFTPINGTTESALDSFLVNNNSGNGTEAGVQITTTGQANGQVTGQVSSGGLPSWFWWAIGGVGVIAGIGLIAWAMSGKKD